MTLGCFVIERSGSQGSFLFALCKKADSQENPKNKQKQAAGVHRHGRLVFAKEIKIP